MRVPSDLGHTGLVSSFVQAGEYLLPRRVHADRPNATLEIGGLTIT